MTPEPAPDNRLNLAYLLSLIIAVLTGVCVGIIGAAAAIYVIWVMF